MGIIDKKAFINDSAISVLHSNMLQDYITQVQKAQSIEEIHTVCSHITHDHGFDYFIYGTPFILANQKPYKVVISGFPDDWHKHYFENNYQCHDPVVFHCLKQVTPIFWDTLLDSPNINDISKRVMQESNDFGLCNGISVPIHGAQGESALLSLCSKKNSHMTQSSILTALPQISLLTKYIHEASRRILIDENDPTYLIQLTPREKEVLQWVAEGKESWVIASILNIAERTVIFHIQNVCNKMGVYKRQHAVAKAISLKLISL